MLQRFAENTEKISIICMAMAQSLACSSAV
jgi:hypothetical protein